MAGQAVVRKQCCRDIQHILDTLSTFDPELTDDCDEYQSPMFLMKYFVAVTTGEYDSRSFARTATSTVFMLFDEEDNNIATRDENSIEVLMHELNHQLGANDHYHENEDDEICENYINGCSDCGATKRPESCIMQESRIDITSETVLCDACYSDILAHLKLHHEG